MKLPTTVANQDGIAQIVVGLHSGMPPQERSVSPPVNDRYATPPLPQDYYEARPRHQDRVPSPEGDHGAEPHDGNRGLHVQNNILRYLSLYGQAELKGTPKVCCSLIPDERRLSHDLSLQTIYLKVDQPRDFR